MTADLHCCHKSLILFKPALQDLQHRRTLRRGGLSFRTHLRTPEIQILLLKVSQQIGLVSSVLANSILKSEPGLHLDQFLHSGNLD